MSIALAPRQMRSRYGKRPMASEANKPQKQDQLAGIISIVVAVQVISFSDAAAKYLSMTLPLLVALWGRFFFHALFTGVYVGLCYGRRALNPAVSRILLARGAALFLAVGLLYATIQRIPLTTGLTLWFIEPFVLTLLCYLFLREKSARCSGWRLLPVLPAW